MVQTLCAAMTRELPFHVLLSLITQQHVRALYPSTSISIWHHNLRAYWENNTIVTSLHLSLSAISPAIK